MLKIFAFLQQNMPGFSLSQLMDKYRMERNLRYVDAFIVREIERLRQEGRSGTAGLYLSGLYSLRRFLRGQKITFRELTYCFLTDYIHFLRMRGISENTVNMYIRNLRAVYNKAQKQGINMGCESPFRELKLQTQETAKRALCKHDIARIVSVIFPPNLYWIVPGIFLCLVSMPRFITLIINDSIDYRVMFKKDNIDKRHTTGIETKHKKIPGTIQ